MKFLRVGLVLGILGLGIVAMAFLVSHQPEAKQTPRSEIGTVVEVRTIEPSSEVVSVLARGTVSPARQVPLGPQVGGKVVAVSSKLEPGGRFAAGELMLRIDPSEYRLALDQQFAAVDGARTQLEIEESRKRVAEREWQTFQKEREREQAESSALALREPQLRTAKVNLKAAKSGLERARLNVSRTTIEAPFNGIVQSRAVDVGQMVSPGAPLATLVGTDDYWVQVSVPISQLGWLDVPGIRGAEQGSAAIVRQEVGDEVIVRKGRVVRLFSGVDPAGHMAQLLVEINDPLGLSPETETVESSSDLPLLLGAYVEVEIEGKKASEVFEIPRVALREGDSVYLMGDDDTLEQVDIAEHILWRKRDTVLVSGGLDAGDRLIVSPVPAPVPGMKLRLPGGSDAMVVAPDASAPAAGESRGDAATAPAGKAVDGDTAAATERP